MNNLNQLSDAELSAVFAVEVAGNKPEKLAFASRDEGKSGVLFEDSRYSYDRFTHLNHVEEFCEKHPEYKIHFRYVSHGNFATSMDAVLPYLEKRTYFVDRGVVVIGYKDSYEYFTSGGSSVSRNACIALILAARAEKEAAK